jgi:kinesin family protein 4/21/27
VYDENVSQSHLYSCVGADGMLEAFLDGYNSTIMAYGQTGSGKTFTMGSEADYQYQNQDSDLHEGIHENQGLIPRFMNDIFSLLHQRKMMGQEMFLAEKGMLQGKANENNPMANSQKYGGQLIDYQVSATFLEVYGEDIHDLLGDDSRQVLPLREDGEGGIVVVGLKEQRIYSVQDAMKALHDGTLNRTTAATLMNKKSSRSHAVFTIILKQTTREYKCDNLSSSQNSNDVEMDVTTISRFTFVDLAGSERMKKTGAEGKRAKEGIDINKGLLALGNVINALADDERLMKGEHVHVPYRQSKLTRLLQDALGGNSQTLFLACVSPSDTNASETASTLKYANRARNIKNAPTKNVDSTIAEIQRLKSLNNFLELELIRVKFGLVDENVDVNKNTDEDQIGKPSKELIESIECQDYLRKVREIASTSLDCSSLSKAFPQKRNKLDEFSVKTVSDSVNTSLVRKNSTCDASQTGAYDMKTRRQNFVNSIDDSILGVNPDEDIALLDKLLELQHIDQEFATEAIQDREQLNQVEGEIEAQEKILLQLKDNMKGYHNLKDKFEAMMIEIQSLEAEKSALAKQLESAQIDPSKGCSKAIKKRLDDVESKLARARSETRKNQQMYRRLEQEAQKAKVLQQKIEQLKQGKIALIKKQRESAIRHRESTEAKTREIESLKRKEKKNGQKVTKLEAEVQKQKLNLEKRKMFCDKLSEKLKKTETHLMKVLAMRRREVTSRPKNIFSGCRDTIGNEDASKFAPRTEEIDSLTFLIEKLIMDKVSVSIMKASYEAKTNEYSDLMRSISHEMKLLSRAKDRLRNCRDDEDSSEIELSIRDSTEVIEDLEVRLDVLEEEMEHIRSKIPHIDSNDIDEGVSRFESDAMKMVANLSTPVSKTLLWNLIEVASNSETNVAHLRENLKRKELALTSCQNEIENLNQQITHLSEDRRRNNLCSANEDRLMSTDLERLKQHISRLEKENEHLMMTMEEKDALFSSIKEKMTVMEVTMKNAGIEAKEEVLRTLNSLQDIWDKIGYPLSERERARSNIEACLENSCYQALQDAKDLKSRYEEEVVQLQEEIQQIYVALGFNAEFDDIQRTWSSEHPLMRRINNLKQTKMKILPMYNNALERRRYIISEVESTSSSMGISHSSLSDDLIKLLSYKGIQLKKKMPLIPGSPVNNHHSSKHRRATQFKIVEDMVRALETVQDKNEDSSLMTESKDEIVAHYPGALSDDFLSLCEQDVKKLKMEKTTLKVCNQQMREEAKKLTFDMHLRGRELLSLSIHSMKKKTKDLPEWWDPRVAEEVCRSIVSKEATIKVNPCYTNHLKAIHSSLHSVSKGRKTLSSTLHDIVKSAHNSLLSTVAGQLDAGEAYSSFDAALARLPPLSKERVYACIQEMNTLIDAVEVMAQSEIEALTVVWDALNISQSEKGDFWGEVEKATKSHESQPNHDFDEVLKTCTVDIEEWLLSAVKDAQKTHRTLSNGLMKLNKIHDEVERLSNKQAIKSRVITLNSELCILSAKLAEFEQEANSRQRLTKKMNSSSLLKEEKFRREMQNNFTSKLKTLSKLAHEWHSLGGKIEDDLISPDIRPLLDDPEAAEKRTAFMHLKTVQQRTKRGKHYSSSVFSLHDDNASSDHSAQSGVYARAASRSSSREIKQVDMLGNKRSIGARVRLSQSSSNHRIHDGSQTLLNRNSAQSPYNDNVEKNMTVIDQKLKNKSPKRIQLPQNGTKSNRRVGKIMRISSITNVNTNVEDIPSPKMLESESTVAAGVESPILPFGHVLRTPTEKENFRF